LKAYEKMGYDALNIGDTDMVLGINYLKTLQESSKIPFLSANLMDKKTEKPFFQPYLIKMVNGLRIGIIGLLTPEVLPHVHKEMEGYFIEDPIKVAAETVHRFMSDCDQIIALAHLHPSEIESIVQEVPQISIIIGGNDRSFVFPKHIHRSIYVQTDAFGLHVGRLNLRLVKGSKEFVDVLPKRLIRKNIDEVQKKMEDPQYEKEMSSLRRIQEILLEQERKLPDTEGKNTYENFLTLLHSEMGSDPEIESMISSSRDQLRRPLP
jgi:2',3'-cyclic-nucleotide 2'-phosphodiesterase (5'-nucleotidase family)